MPNDEQPKVPEDIDIDNGSGNDDEGGKDNVDNGGNEVDNSTDD